MNYITGNVSAQRVLSFDPFCAYQGESNNNILKIDIGELGEFEADFYVLKFAISPFECSFTSNKIADEFDSPAYIEENFIYCPLTEILTGTSRLDVQLCAHKINEKGEEIIEKTSTETLNFNKSIGKSTFLIQEDLSLYAEIEVLKQKTNEISGALAEFSPEYLSVALTAQLLYEGENTPIYFPFTLGSAQRKIEEICDNYDFENTKYVLVAVPGSETTQPYLVVIHGENGELVISRHERGAVRELLLSGVFYE